MVRRDPADCQQVAEGARRRPDERRHASLAVGLHERAVGVEARKKAHAKNTHPERRRKIAEAMRGKPRPRHVVEAMRKGRMGKPQPPHVGQIVAANYRKRKANGIVPRGRAWTEEDDQIVRNNRGTVAAQMLGRTLASVYSRRTRLGLTGL